MSEPKPRGRPKDLDKRAAILRSARHLFMEKGFEAVKMEDIARHAVISKMTVYANFSDKSAIFQAVVEHQAKHMERCFEQFQIGTNKIDVILLKLGQKFLTLLLSVDVMRFEQSLGAAMKNHTGLGERFFEAGPNHIWTLLTKIINLAMEKSELKTNDPKLAAEDLIALWLGNVPLQHRFKELPALDNNDIDKRVIRGVQNFMKIYGQDEPIDK